MRRQLLTEIESVSFQTAVRLGNQVLLEYEGRKGKFGYSFAHGSSGLAVFAHTLYRLTGDEHWRRASRDFLWHAIQTAQASNALPCGLFSGAAGLLFASLYVSGDSADSTLVRSLAKTVQVGSAALATETVTSKTVRASQIDLINGLTGIGLALMQVPPCAALMTIFAELERRITITNEFPSALFVPAAAIESKPLRSVFLDGMVDSGVAHGIAGPLSLLALAAIGGMPVRTPSLEAACEWLIARAARDEFGPFWYPGYDRSFRPPNLLNPPRNAWCYGIAGIANTIWLCGVACYREDLKTYAAATMLSGLLRKPAGSEPILCHGNAGLLQFVRVFYERTKDRMFQAHLERITADTIQSASAHSYPEPEKSLGLLEGLAGLGLVLCGNVGDGMRWDRAFAIV